MTANNGTQAVIEALGTKVDLECGEESIGGIEGNINVVSNVITLSKALNDT